MKQPTTYREALAFALEARDVQLGGSPHITPGNAFYLEAADTLIALTPPLAPTTCEDCGHELRDHGLTIGCEVRYANLLPLDEDGICSCARNRAA